MLFFIFYISCIIKLRGLFMPFLFMDSSLIRDISQTMGPTGSLCRWWTIEKFSERISKEKFALVSTFSGHEWKGIVGKKQWRSFSTVAIFFTKTMFKKAEHCHCYVFKGFKTLKLPLNCFSMHRWTHIPKRDRSQNFSYLLFPYYSCTYILLQKVN